MTLATHAYCLYALAWSGSDADAVQMNTTTQHFSLGGIELQPVSVHPRQQIIYTDGHSFTKDVDVCWVAGTKDLCIVGIYEGL